MADESPQEREERLNRQEERLQKQHARVKESRSMPRTSSAGSGFKHFGEALGGFFSEHKVILLAVIGFAVVFYVIQKGKSNQTTAQTGANASPDYSTAGYQTQGEAFGFDQLTQGMQNILQQLQNMQQNPPAGGTTSGGGTVSGGGGGTVPSLNWKAPLIPSGTYSGPSFSNLKPNTSYTYQGVKYILSAGSQGRLWGKNPQGQQVLLYGPPSQYVPPTLNPLANHSPIQNFMKLSPESVPGADITHGGVAFGSMRKGPVGVRSAEGS